MSELTFQLKRLVMEYRLKPVRVIVVKDLGKVVVDGVEYTLNKGIEIEVPQWLADVLEDMSIANSAERSLDIEDIARVHFSTLSARTAAELEPLPKDFYLEALRYIEKISQRAQKELNISLLEEQQKAIRYLLEIIDKRLSLILQGIRSPLSIAEISSKMTPEELLLVNTLREKLDEWRQFVSPKIDIPTRT